MKKELRKAILLVLVSTLLIGSVSLCTEAAATKTVKKSSLTHSTKEIEKTATTVKKGKTNLKFKKGKGYIKFKAPSTKTYSFKFSNVKDKTTEISMAAVGVQIKDPKTPKYSPRVEVSTKGGKSDKLFLAVDKYVYKEGKTIEHFLASRTAKIKLKKGQVLYFYFLTSSECQASLSLTIK